MLDSSSVFFLIQKLWLIVLLYIHILSRAERGRFTVVSERNMYGHEHVMARVYHLRLNEFFCGYQQIIVINNPSATVVRRPECGRMENDICFVFCLDRGPHA